MADRPHLQFSRVLIDISIFGVNMFSKKIPSVKKLSFVKQDSIAECGHACITMLCNYHGHKIDLPALRAMEPPSLSGTSLLEVMRIFEKMNFHVRALKVEDSELKFISLPAILYWDMNHFVVLKSVSKKNAVIYDPAVGERKLSLKTFFSFFSGVVLEIEKNESFHVIKAEKKLFLSDFFKSIRGFKSSLFALLVLSIAIEVFVLLNPLLLQYVTDSVLNTHNPGNLHVVVAGFLMLTICYSSVEYVRSHFVVYLTNMLSEYFSMGVMRHLIRLPYTYFEQRYKGDILSKFHAVNEIQNKVTAESISAFLDGIVAIVTLLIMFVYSAYLSMIVVLSVGVFVLIRVLAYNGHRDQTALLIGERAQANSRFLEIIQSITTIKLFAKENTMLRLWQNHLINSINADVKIARVNVLYAVAAIFIFNIEHILVIWAGALLVLHSQFSIGMLMAFLAYRQLLVSKLSSFIQRYFDFKLISVQLGRVADILTESAENLSSDRHYEFEETKSLELKNVSFRYGKTENWVIKEFSFKIEPGEKVAITGSSGAGKTTLIKILLGLLSPTEGEIFFGEIPLSTVGLAKYRSLCASVMQDDALITGTIWDNITFMDSKANLNKVYEVAKLAQIHDDILNMPMQYGTLIGDLGNTLSGGQRQRILLARALYKNPKILFLDEATSHLDVETEIKINAALKQLNITQIIIAHREESIKMADRSVVVV